MEQKSSAAARAARWGWPAAAVLAAACSGGGGGGSGGGSGTIPPGDSPGIGTILSSAAVTPELGGLLVVSGDDPERAGVSLDVPPRSVQKAETINVGTPEHLPASSPLGQDALGQAFVFEPEGTTFDEPATLSLPLSAPDAAQDVYVGRWDPAAARWEDLGGTVDGDFVSVEVEHLSLYGLFYRGRSLVRVTNDAATPQEDLGIELHYVSGPVPPADIDLAEPFPAYRPLEIDPVDLEHGASRLFSLLPGAYHFVVSYPHPQPGVANSLFFTVPELASGADDATIDQTLTIRFDGASSSDATTDASIRFEGASTTPATNLRPAVNLDAIVPPGVLVRDALTNGAVGPTTRIVRVGPVKVEDLDGPGSVILQGTAVDPEGHSPLHLCWTWTWGTLPTHEFVGNGTKRSRSFSPNPRRAGTYTVYFTAYDEFGLFDEGRWIIEVVPNTRPTIEVIADDVIVDFGRLDAFRRDGSGTGTCLPISGPVPGIADYVDTDADGVVDTTVLKTLPAVGPARNPLQDPTSLTCIYAIVSDLDGDPLTAGFVLPTPIFGRGTVYAAVAVPAGPGVPNGLNVGELIDTYAEMDAYNAQLSALANAGLLPVDTTMFPGRPPGAQALPIVWEAPDDPDSPTDSTNDCSEFAGCQLSNGGTVNVLAKVTDGFSPERKDFATLGYPDDELVCQIVSVTPNPPDPGPNQGVTVEACVFPRQAGITVHFLIEGTDGYTNSSSPLTDGEGCATFYIPGGAEGVHDVVTVRCGSSQVLVTYTF